MDLIVDRSDLRKTRLVTLPEESAPRSGHVRLRIEKFALTANNVTYGVVGEMVGYWKFFPAEAGSGRIPVWGIAAVVAGPAAEANGLRTGERIYGYFPMSTHLDVEPIRVTERGFVDGTAHRAELPTVYNQYTRLENEPGYGERDDDRLMLLRPLFTTAFLLDDFFAENDFFGASTVLLASASSKTAFSLAHLLSRNRKPGPEVIGLTSEANRDFVAGLGCYDRVATYDAVSSLPSGRDVVLVDMAGNERVTRAVHAHFGDGVRYSCQVGLTHWEGGGSTDDLPGARPEFFFAPSRIGKRNADWGAAELQSRITTEWRTFLDATEGWLRIRQERGPEAVQRAYLDTVEGRVRPSEGRILSLER